MDTGTDSILTNWDQCIPVIDEEFKSQDDHSQRRIVWIDNGWTIIEDFSLYFVQTNLLGSDFPAFVYACFFLATRGTSGSYAFWYFDKQKLRSFGSTMVR